MQGSGLRLFQTGPQPIIAQCSLEEAEKTEHTYSVGGITFSVESDLPIAVKERFFVEEPPCSVFGERNETLSLRISSCPETYIKREKIFSLQRTDLYTTAEGYLQEFYSADDKKELLWTVAINRAFSQFDYALHSRRSEKAFTIPDPYGPIFSLFLLQHSVINHQGLIIHAAGGALHGKGIAFAAPSGTGKSTLSRLLGQASGHQLFSEERLILRSVAEQWHLWGTPWHGQSDLARNASCPLSALVFLRQSETTEISWLRPAAGLRRLLQVVSVPWYSEEWAEKGIALCERLIQDVPIFELAFRPDRSTVQAVKRFAAEV